MTPQNPDYRYGQFQYRSVLRVPTPLKHSWCFTDDPVWAVLQKVRAFNDHFLSVQYKWFAAHLLRKIKSPARSTAQMGNLSLWFKSWIFILSVLDVFDKFQVIDH